MQWGATDQFGNLYVGESTATTLEELQPHLVSMVEELSARTEGAIQITIDVAYKELNGPHPEQVSHVLQVPNLVCFQAGQAKEQTLAEISTRVSGICADKGITRVSVVIV